MPLDCFTVAVSVTGLFSLTEEEDADKVVVVPITAGFAFTPRLKVTVCTRSPLTAHRVTGTVCTAEVEDAVSVRIEDPLLRLGALKRCGHAGGNPETLRLTVPKLKELTRTVAVARPDDMV